MQLLSRFTLPEILKQKGQQFIPEKILDAMRFVQANLHLPITVTSLAERANQNAEYFSRTFEAHTGTRPLAYITEKRVQRAQHMIVTSRLSHESIAKLTGFKSIQFFKNI